MVVPLVPVVSQYQDSDQGPVGVSVSGAFFYNHRNPKYTNQVAVVKEGKTFDTCMGHVDKLCRQDNIKNKHF